MIQNKKNKRNIAITGSISTGKSTVTKLLIERGFPVIDADKVSRKVVEVGKPAYKDIVKQFGDEILNSDMTIDRAKLGNIIFNDGESRLYLNNIVHLRVVEEIIKQVKMYSKNNNIIFLDIPLLIEEMDRLKELGLEFDEIWLVYTDKDMQLKRLMKRDNIDKKNALGKIKSQMSIEDKRKFADVIIDNTEGFEELKNSVDKLLATM